MSQMIKELTKKDLAVAFKRLKKDTRGFKTLIGETKAEKQKGSALDKGQFERIKSCEKGDILWSPLPETWEEGLKRQ